MPDRTLEIPMRSLLFVPLAALALLVACPTPDEPVPPPAARHDPLAALAPDPDALTDLSDDLEALLEFGDLDGACDRYWAGEATGRTARLLCGKEMFFYETFDGVGVPVGLATFMMETFPTEVGAGFAQHGMILDPYSELGLPLGYADGAPIEEVETINLTCASCHFAQLPDGRYAVGAANHEFDYGVHNVTLMLVAEAVIAGTDHLHPDAAALVAPLAAQVAADPDATQALVDVLSPLVGVTDMPEFGEEAQGQYLSWPPGVLDALITPVPIDDGAHTPTKMRSIWGIPGPAEEAAAGMTHAMLGAAGSVHSVASFLEGFVLFFGAQDLWTAERLGPLEEYIYTLRRPANPAPPTDSEAAAGLAVFHDAGCIDCHGGPRASGTELFTFEEIGTDPALRGLLDPEEDGTVCCGAEFVEGEGLTYALKSPRLAGLWQTGRFFHNGALVSLEQVLCLEGDRTITQPPFATSGHEYGCGLPENERRALIDYLLAR